MSSRNLLLTTSQRKSAKLISQVLFRAKELTSIFSVEELKNFVIDSINQDPNLKVEYFEIADADTLMPIEDWSETNKPIALIAVYDGDIRLIDNMELF
jgi:pantoate--beta-alanine ligase